MDVDHNIKNLNNNFDKRIEDYDKAIKLNPDLAKDINNLGNCDTGSPRISNIIMLNSYKKGAIKNTSKPTISTSQENNSMSIDTLNTSDNLEKGGFNQTQARSLTATLAELHNTNASKEDLKALEKQVTNQIQTLSTSSKEDIKALEKQVTNQIQTLSKDVDHNIKILETNFSSLEDKFSSLEQKMFAQISILGNNINNLNNNINNLNNNSDKRIEDMKWFIGLSIGVAISLSGLILALSRIF